MHKDRFVRWEFNALRAVIFFLFLLKLAEFVAFSLQKTLGGWF